MNPKVRFLDPQAEEPLELLPPGQVAREPRVRALLIATVSNFDDSQIAPCIVTSLSASGARIKISEAVPLSGDLKISIPQRNIARTARQVWRKRDRLGVVFLADQESTGEETETAHFAKIRALEAEVTALKAEIGVLKYQLYRREQ